MKMMKVGQTKMLCSNKYSCIKRDCAGVLLIAVFIHCKEVSREESNSQNVSKIEHYT